MPRRARLSLAGSPWHIIQRGNNRSVCFDAQDDYQFYLHYLKEFADRFGCALHAYVLMTTTFICRRRPRAHVAIVGGDEVSYGKRLPAGQTYRQKLSREVSIDPQRVHFLGRIPYARYLRLLQVSAAHVYLTVPFVLSWSMLEAMSAGCLVIGSDTAPVREVLRDGENGLLEDFFSPSKIADRVDEVLEQPGRMRAIREAARKTIVECYDVRDSIVRYERLIGTMCEGAELKVSARRAA